MLSFTQAHSLACLAPSPVFCTEMSFCPPNGGVRWAQAAATLLILWRRMLRLGGLTSGTDPKPLDYMPLANTFRLLMPRHCLGKSAHA